MNAEVRKTPHGESEQPQVDAAIEWPHHLSRRGESIRGGHTRQSVRRSKALNGRSVGCVMACACFGPHSSLEFGLVRASQSAVSCWINALISKARHNSAILSSVSWK